MRWLIGCLAALALAGCAPARQATFTPGEGWIPLFNGKDLSGWKNVGRYPSEWTVKDGLTGCPKESDNLYTERKFLNFQLHCEWQIPKEGNSGIFLRGRKEVQIADSYGKKELEKEDCGGIWGKFAPSVNACKPPGEWNTYDITMVGRKVTVVFNGKTVIDGITVDGVTGWQLDENEDQPGSLMIQADHSAVWFRSLWIKPLPDGKP